MKRIVKEEMVKKTTEVFEAKDGKVFSTEEQCREWEKQLECTINAAWNQIPKGSFNEEAMCWGSNCDDKFYIIVPRNFEDVKIINMYTGLTGTDILTQDDIGKEVVLEECCGSDWYRIKKGFQQMHDNIDKGIASMKKELEGYGLYEISVVSVGFTHKCYSYDECFNRTTNKIINYMRQNKLSTMEVKVIVTKDGEAYEDSTYQCEYNSEIGYNSFKMEKGE